MAMVGLQHAVFAPITKETEGTALVYGTGVVVGRMMQADVTYERNTDPLYADDVEAENDNSITGGTVTIGVDDIDDAARAVVFGDYQDGETGEYEDNSQASPYGGFGYVRTRRHKGVTSFVAYWIHKLQFGSTSESAQTKANTITWQTPTLNGNIMGVNNNANGQIRFRRRKEFTKAADAIAWVDQLAGIAATAQTGA